jgi:hypothetical protein
MALFPEHARTGTRRLNGYLRRLQLGGRSDPILAGVKDLLRRTTPQELVRLHGDLWRGRRPRAELLWLGGVHLELLHDIWLRDTLR